MPTSSPYMVRLGAGRQIVMGNILSWKKIIKSTLVLPLISVCYNPPNFILFVVLLPIITSASPWSVGFWWNVFSGLHICLQFSLSIICYQIHWWCRMLLSGGCRATMHGESYFIMNHEKSLAEDIPTPGIRWWRITFISKQPSHRTQQQGRKWSYSCRWLIQPHTICGGVLVVSQARHVSHSWDAEQWVGCLMEVHQTWNKGSRSPHMFSSPG